MTTKPKLGRPRKIDWQTLRDIAKAKGTQTAIAKKYGVNQQVVSYVQRTWKAFNKRMRNHETEEISCN